MTCIVGVQEGGHVYIGGDSAGVSTLDIVVRADEKVFVNGPFIMGFTTSFRMGQLFRYAFKPPKRPKGASDMQYMTTTFIDAVRKCYDTKGFLTKRNNVDEGGEFLVGYRGKLYDIESDFQVGVQVLPYYAVGCGAKYALGALSVLPESLTPETRITRALGAAVLFSGGVRPPFVVLKK
jgi:hypothetical protein